MIIVPRHLCEQDSACVGWWKRMQQKSLTQLPLRKKVIVHVVVLEDCWETLNVDFCDLNVFDKIF